MPHDPRPARTNLLAFHRPRPRLPASLPQISRESRRCLRNLAAHRARPALPAPRTRTAAVLIALFVGRAGDLYVVLSRRAASLRTYAGDTALPGGRTDPEDRSPEDTARREAFEEIGLPRDPHRVPLLCVLEPFPAANALVVTPVVVLVLDRAIRPLLNDAEVAELFSHPLAAFLTDAPPFPTEPGAHELPYHTQSDARTRYGPVRMHRFLTGREAGGTKPIYGLTAAILIHAARIGYARAPAFEVEAPGGPTPRARIARALLHDPVYREAYVTEGLVPDERRLKAAAHERFPVGSRRAKL